MMTNTPQPETSEEVLWMVFSLLSLDPARQVEILGGLPSQEEADEKALMENGAAHLLHAIQHFYVSWIDEFEPCPSAQKLFDLAWSTSYRQSSYESFMNGDNWKQLRVLAKSTLKEAGLEPWPVPPHIDFHDYMEIVSSEDVAKFVDPDWNEKQRNLWVEAAKMFALDPDAKMTCPVCKEGILQSEDISLPDNDMIERRIYCHLCDAQNFMRFPKRMPPRKD